MNIVKLLILFFLLNIFSCSSSIEETREESVIEEEDTYIFDEAPENDSEGNDELSEKVEEFFLIQIGAFTTKQKAENFAQESQTKLGREVKATYSSDVNLFVVQLTEKFQSKQEAESVRNQIQQIEEFKDAWILSSLK